ncbi:alanine racemase [Protaetiibacter intestinalis]|uniref:Alanine racemase n=1 Tax=Protaetiibacter intestinalis TaxID=2419774 RepID=A0A387B7H5_9MICO|nr:alanine racemase [Protaetiibacter intestinalis]
MDARADAYGHSLALVGPVARELGFTGVVVSDDADAARARALGFRDIVAGRSPVAESLTGPEVYGLAPGARPVLTLEGEIVAVKRVGAGAGVSYGYTHRTERPTTLALVGLGYADGVPRLASNRAEVLVAEGRRPLVGRIAMDQFVASCGDDTPVLGAHAVLFGDPAHGAPSALEWAAWTERDPLALTAGLGHRIRREAR